LGGKATQDFILAFLGLEKNMNKKRFWSIVFYYLLLVLGLGLILGGYVWYLNKQNLVRLGLCRSNFPYAKYSLEELENLYPQYPNEKVATVQTPEQTYAKFIAALKKGDVEGVMVNFTERKYKEYKESFSNDIKNNKLEETKKLFDRKLILRNQSDVSASYYLENLEHKYFIEFVKGVNGIWKIDSL
jgi:hypothetical protein